MTGKKVESMLSWFRRHYDEFKDDNYAYYNVKKILTETDIDKIRNFCSKRSEIIFFIIISGVNELRPQRTYGGMPEWFRNNTSAHDIYKSENSFVFIGCFDKEWCGWGRFEEEKKNLFENAEDIAKSINSDCIIWER